MFAAQKTNSLTPEKENTTLSEQASREAEFFDRSYLEADRAQKAQGYIVPHKIVDLQVHPSNYPLSDFQYAFNLLGNIEGKKLLDFGAGDGWNSVGFARANARVWAIDVSEKGIELIRKKAMANQVQDKIIAEVRNCYQTGFPDSFFDVIYGGGILHHLDVMEAGREISRILQPNGTAVFYEPIRDTPVMEVLKAIVLKVTKRKKSETTEDERPLTSRDISLLQNHFNHVSFRYFNVLTAIAKLFREPTMNSALSQMDEFLMKTIPGFKKLGMAVVIKLQKPKSMFNFRTASLGSAKPFPNVREESVA